MGTAMMDFFIREVRAITSGPLVIIRFGSCGSVGSAKLGNIVVATDAIYIQRNYNHFTNTVENSSNTMPYTMTLPCQADPKLSALMAEKLREKVGPDSVKTGLNASADTFYASQGREDSAFNDDNDKLILDLKNQHCNLETLEMETFMVSYAIDVQLFHLAHCAKKISIEGGSVVKSIHPAACAMVFAQRLSNNFLEHDQVHRLEDQGGLAILEALVEYKITE